MKENIELKKKEKPVIKNRGYRWSSDIDRRRVFRGSKGEKG